MTSRHANFYNISLNPRLDQVASSLAQSARSATLLASDEEMLVKIIWARHMLRKFHKKSSNRQNLSELVLISGFL